MIKNRELIEIRDKSTGKLVDIINELLHYRELSRPRYLPNEMPPDDSTDVIVSSKRNGIKYITDGHFVNETEIIEYWLPIPEVNNDYLA